MDRLKLDPPDRAVIEASFFGPGFGESAAIHLGSGYWAIVDSCVTPGTTRPAALEYLKSIGTDPKAVQVILITHWHDDHIRGMASTVAECTNATVCFSAAFRNEEFVSFILAHKGSEGIQSVSGGAVEMYKVLSHLQATGRRATTCSNSKRLLQIDTDAGHVEMWALSPSEAQFAIAMGALGASMPRLMDPKRRAASPEPNDLSIAAWINVGDHSLLLGADLEEPGNLELGWSAVLRDKNRPSGKAHLFKIAHHGSPNGHHDDVWNEMLLGDAVAVLTPYNKGKGLPGAADVNRILARTKMAYATSKLKPNRFRRPRPRAVERTIEEMGVRLASAQAPVGHVRVRFTAGEPTDIRLFENACNLDQCLP